MLVRIPDEEDFARDWREGGRGEMEREGERERTHTHTYPACHDVITVVPSISLPLSAAPPGVEDARRESSPCRTQSTRWRSRADPPYLGHAAPGAPRDSAPAPRAAKLKKFIQEFESAPGEFKYMNMLQEVANRKQRVIDIALDDLENFGQVRDTHPPPHRAKGKGPSCAAALGTRRRDKYIRSRN